MPGTTRSATGAATARTSPGTWSSPDRDADERRRDRRRRPRVRTRAAARARPYPAGLPRPAGFPLLLRRHEARAGAHVSAQPDLGPLAAERDPARRAAPLTGRRLVGAHAR